MAASVTVQISAHPPPRWREFAGDSLFRDPAWLAVLSAGLAARPLYLCAAPEQAVAVPVFRRGPVAVGYPDFPVGVRALAHGCALSWSRALSGYGVHGMRVVKPDGHDGWPAARARMARSRIARLQGWDEGSLPSSLRRNLRKAVRLGLDLVALAGDDDARDMHALYRDTVLRHGGALRYTPGYFRALLALSGRDARLWCAGVRRGGRLTAFVCVGDAHGDACYLHGAQDPAYQSERAMDLLFARAIAAARDRGLDGFDFLASPAGQDSLVRFKEKWGAHTADEFTHDLPAPGPAGALFALAARAAAWAAQRRVRGGG